jgi:hypothetical protein
MLAFYAVTISRVIDMASVKRQAAAVSKAKEEAVHHPKHYRHGVYECINVIEAWGLGFHLGNTVKYIARAGLKGDLLEDLRKAAWYLDREIKRRDRDMRRLRKRA